MKRVVLVSIAIVLSLTLVGCLKPSKPTLTPPEAGYALIVDSESKVPIKGATVSIDGDVLAASDSQGLVALSSLDNGIYTLRIDASGYLSKLELVEIDEGFAITIELEEYVEKTTQVVQLFILAGQQDSLQTSPVQVNDDKVSVTFGRLRTLVLDEETYRCYEYEYGRSEHHIYTLDEIAERFSHIIVELSMDTLEHVYDSLLDNGDAEIVHVDLGTIVRYEDTNGIRWEENNMMTHTLVLANGQWRIVETISKFLAPRQQIGQ